MPGLLDLPIELRLTISKDVFDQDQYRYPLTHPRLHVCRTTRLEYIDVLSGTFSLSIIGTPGLATHPGLDPLFYRLLTPKFFVIHKENSIPLHPRKKRMDLFTFAGSSYGWLLEHASGASIRPRDFGSGCTSYRSHRGCSKPIPNYTITFADGFEIQPFLDTDDFCRRNLSNKGDMLEIARKELAYWKSGQISQENSRPLSATDKPLSDRRTRWILAFMREFDADGLEFKMTGKLRDYVMLDRSQDLHGLLRH
ncbi:hypothetical protein KCU65_g4495, partial [Aureobasidium melanogenum]